MGLSDSMWAYSAHKRRRSASNSTSILEYTPRLLFPEKISSGMSHVKTEAMDCDPSENTISNFHSGVNVSKWKIYNHGPVKSAQGTIARLYEGRSIILSNGAGVQGCFEFYNTGTGLQWLNASNPPGPAQSEYAYFDINPYDKITGSGIFTNNTFLSNDRLLLKYEAVMMDFSNVSTSATQVRLYAFKCKKYTSLGPLNYWNQDLIDMGEQGPGAATVPAAGLITNTPGYMNYQFPYMAPKGCKTLSEFYHLQGVNEFNLNAGGHEKLRVDIVHNMLGIKEAYNKAGTIFVPGSTVFVLVQLGVPVVDVTTGGGPLATFSSNETAVTMTARKAFQPIKNNAGRAKPYVGWDTIPAGATLANQKLVNVVDAVVSNTQT